VLLKLGTEIAAILENFPQVSEGAELEGGVGHLVRDRLGDEEVTAHNAAEDSWGRTFSCLTEPAVRNRKVQLRPPESALSIEDLEAEAIRAEGCGKRRCSK
jgi:hypothetical protein